MYDRESLLNIDKINEAESASGLNAPGSNESINRANQLLVEAEADEIIKGILKEFAVFCSLPHGSGNEAQLVELLCKRFQDEGFNAYITDGNNLICDIPAVKGMEDAPLVALQGHIDMVCAVRENSAYDPSTDAIAMKIDVDGSGKRILSSTGDSSLGADCGMCDAAVIWLLTSSEEKFAHGPLRLIFTVEEEEGLLGAQELKKSVLDNVKYLINLDGFDADHIVAGCSGGRSEIFSKDCESMSFEPENLKEWCAFEFTLTGFKGGHSGYDIDKGRVNAIKLIADLLADMFENEMSYLLSSFNGGVQHNIIPSSASAVVVFRREELIKCQRSIQMLMYELSMHYGESDWGGRFVYHEIALPRRVLTEQCTKSVVKFVHGLCNGVYAYTDIEKDRDGALVVDTSINIGKISCKASASKDSNHEGKIEILIFLRAISDTFSSILLRMNNEAAEEYGFESTNVEYPSWHFDKSSELLNAACRAYRKITGKTAVATAAHVGLEPAVFTELAPDLEMISMGADIRNAHSISESVNLGSVKEFILTLKDLLSNIGNVSGE